MATWRWRLSTDRNGAGSWEFAVNPQEVVGLWPDRAYNAIPILRGVPIVQFPDVDTRLRSMSMESLPDNNVSFTDFLFGDSETDTETLLYLQTLDSDGQLTPYYLNIPQERIRPYGYRDEDWIPIRIEAVNAKPEVQSGTWWSAIINFRIIPWNQLEIPLELGQGELDGDNVLDTSQFSKVYVYDLSLASYTDYTTAAYTGGSLLPVLDSGDRVYFGFTSPFWGIYYDFDSWETIGESDHTWKYYISSMWTAFTVVDYTDGFIRDGWVDFVYDALWADDAQPFDLGGYVEGAPHTDDLYWVQFIVGTVNTSWQIDNLSRG